MRQRLVRVLIGLFVLVVCLAVAERQRLLIWWAPIPGTAQETYFLSLIHI